MVRTVYDRGFNVYKREACEYAILHSFFNTLLCRSDILSRNGTTDDFTLELVTSTWFQRFEFNPYVTVLTTTTGLTNEFTFDACRSFERLTISNLWFTYVRLNFEFAAHPVNDDIKVKLTHTSKDRLSRFFIRMSTKRWVFLRQFTESNAHFILVSFRLRFNGDFDNRIREVHRFKNNRCLLITQCITCPRIFQTNSCCDITGVNFGDLLTAVRVHLQDTSDPFAFAFRCIQHVGAGLQNTGVYAEERQLTHIRVGHDFKCKR
ncbi:hypothetical protein D3C74_294060 [compost metagenome]